jgi:hypothetical protein
VAVEGDPVLVAFLQRNHVGVEVLNADARDLSELLVGQEIKGYSNSQWPSLVAVRF